MMGLPLIALMLVAPAEMKCSNHSGVQMPGYAANQPVIVVDGVIVDESAPRLGTDGAMELESLTITCWHPERDAFARDGAPVVYALSRHLVVSTRAPLLQLIEAQEAFRSRHARYAGDLASLEDYGLAPEVALAFEVTDSGWKASTPPGDVAYRCSATEASAGVLRDDGEPKLDCEPVDTLALRALRELHDAGG